MRTEDLFCLMLGNYLALLNAATNESNVTVDERSSCDWLTLAARTNQLRPYIGPKFGFPSEEQAWLFQSQGLQQPSPSVRSFRQKTNWCTRYIQQQPSPTR